MRLFLIMLLLLAVIPRESAAALGEHESSSEKDRKHFHGFRQQVNESGSYVLNIISTEANVIREYSNPNGMIFAVTWRGFSHPDLTTLLGAHWAEFNTQHNLDSNRHPQGKRILKMDTSTIKYEEGGRMGSVYGRAYIPSLVPDGVSPEELP